MLFELTADHRAFREELCAFLSSELTPEVRRRHHDELQYGGGWSVEFRRSFRRKLGERGYLGMSWPVEYGGGGKDMVHNVILAEEIEYHAAPTLEGATGYVPKVLIDFGTEAQKLAFLPRLRRGELSIFLGYSEPDAGSDLANLKTCAVEEGDHFLITGEKVYASHSHIADYGLVAARTGSTSSRHRGISLFLIDMNSPGISVAHYRSVAGFLHHSVHFDHVPVPRTMVVGPIEQGWRVLMSAVNFERSVFSSPGLADRQMDRLLAYSLAILPEGHRLLDDPLVQNTMVTLAVEAEAARLYAYEVAGRYVRGDHLEHETSLLALLKRETGRLADVIGLQLLGPYAQLRGPTPHAPFEGAIEHEYREHLYFQFAAGGFDITRNVIALRGLRLPR